MDHISTRCANGGAATNNKLHSFNDDEFVCINVSGMRYETLRSTLERFPLTLLGNAERRKRYYVTSKNCYFFDRSCQCFDSILYYYQNGGVLIRPPHIPVSTFTSEITFFDLGKNVISSFREKEGYIPKVVHQLPKHPLQKKIWLLFEEPTSSKEARIIAVWSIFVIAVSIIIFCMETMPLFQAQTRLRNKEAVSRNSTYTYDGTILSHAQPWLALELSCTVWFTIEYILRFASSPNKWKFAKSFLNIIDLMAILPYLINLTTSTGHLSPMLRIVRLVRVFRVFKLSRHSIGLQILGHTLRASISELGMLIFFMCIAVVLFSSAIFYAEQGRNTMFKSIPDAFWYSLVTMTTVGYGDKTPTTFPGKILGSLCAVSGVLTIALPVPVIVSNFEYFYKRDRLEQSEDSITTHDDTYEDEENVESETEKQLVLHTNKDEAQC